MCIAGTSSITSIHERQAPYNMRHPSQQDIEKARSILAVPAHDPIMDEEATEKILKYGVGMHFFAYRIRMYMHVAWHCMLLGIVPSSSSSS